MPGCSVRGERSGGADVGGKAFPGPTEDDHGPENTKPDNSGGPAPAHAARPGEGASEGGRRLGGTRIQAHPALGGVGGEGCNPHPIPPPRTQR